MSDANENPERKEEQQKLDEFEENHPEAISENGLGEEKEEIQSSGDQNEQERSESMQQEEVEEQKLNSIEEKDQINDTTSEETVEQKKEDTKEEETKKQTATEESKTTTQSTGYSGWGWSCIWLTSYWAWSSVLLFIQESNTRISRESPRIGRNRQGISQSMN